jgi:hypothetical protein
VTARKAPGQRRNVVSSFTIIKGAMILETYAAFAGWHLAESKAKNLDRLKHTNYIGARTETWLRDVGFVLSRRFDPCGRDRPLVQLARTRCEIEVWKPLLLWHMTRDEFLLRDFLVSWLFPAHKAGVYQIRPDDLYPYLRSIAERGGQTEHEWTEETMKRVATGLLQIAADFGLLQGRAAKEFLNYHMPEQSFLYLLHAMQAEMGSPRKVIDAPDWGMYLMHPSDVEQELLRLHQYRKVDYQVAGSLVQLKLPCAGPAEYAERMAA